MCLRQGYQCSLPHMHQQTQPTNYSEREISARGSVVRTQEIIEFCLSSEAVIK